MSTVATSSRCRRLLDTSLGDVVLTSPLNQDSRACPALTPTLPDATRPCPGSVADLL